MRMYQHVLAASLLILTLAVAGCPSPAPQEPGATSEAEGTTTTTAARQPVEAEPPETVTRVCSQCHGLKDITGKELTPPGQGGPRPDLKDTWLTASPRGDWTSTVDRMQNTNKCDVTDDEKEQIIAWLNAVVK